jgi:uncharacterized membrane protein
LSWDYLHLVTHPFPIVLVTIGTLVGFLGWALGRESLESYGIISILIAGALAIPSYLTGLAAADVVTERTFVQPSVVQTHRTWATFAAFALLTCGVFALFSLLQPGDRRLRRFVFIVAMPAVLLTAMAAFRGGKIEHAESSTAGDAATSSGPAPPMVECIESGARQIEAKCTRENAL